MPLISILQFPLWGSPAEPDAVPERRDIQAVTALCPCSSAVCFPGNKSSRVCSAPCCCSCRLSPSATSLLSWEVLQSWALTLGCSRMLCWGFVSDGREEQPLLVMLLENFPPEGGKETNLSFHTCTESHQPVLAEESTFLRQRLYFQNVFRSGYNLFWFLSVSVPVHLLLEIVNFAFRCWERSIQLMWTMNPLGKQKIHRFRASQNTN